MNISDSWWPFVGFLLWSQILTVVLALLIHLLVWIMKVNLMSALLGGVLTFVGFNFFFLVSYPFRNGPMSDGFGLKVLVFNFVFLLVALAVAALHRKQFDLPLLEGTSGFYLDVATNLFAASFLYSRFDNTKDVFTPAFAVASYVACWFCLTLFRPFLVRQWRVFQLWRH